MVIDEDKYFKTDRSMVTDKFFEFVEYYDNESAITKWETQLQSRRFTDPKEIYCRAFTSGTTSVQVFLGTFSLTEGPVQ